MVFEPYGDILFSPHILAGSHFTPCPNPTYSLRTHGYLSHSFAVFSTGLGIATSLGLYPLTHTPYTGLYLLPFDHYLDHFYYFLYRHGHDTAYTYIVYTLIQ